MNLLKKLGLPFAVIGCLAGFGLAAIVHFLFSVTGTIAIKALLVATGTLIGMWLEWGPGAKKGRD
ncbi:MAG: hypothetical protein Q8N13_02185 [Acidovorax sp.]|nr:hypothetical protein [Acidovorax sp.]